METLETSFHQDLNGDGTIGVPPGQATQTEVTSGDQFLFRDAGDPVWSAGVSGAAGQDIFFPVARASVDAPAGHAMLLSQDAGHETVSGHDALPTGLPVDLFFGHFIVH